MAALCAHSSCSSLENVCGDSIFRIRGKWNSPLSQLSLGRVETQDPHVSTCQIALRRGKQFTQLSTESSFWAISPTSHGMERNGLNSENSLADKILLCLWLVPFPPKHANEEYLVYPSFSSPPPLLSSINLKSWYPNPNPKLRDPIASKGDLAS